MKRIRRTLFLLIVLCTTLVLMPMTVFAAGMINNGIITGTGTWGIDVENTSSGVIVHGNYTKTVYNNGCLLYTSCQEQFQASKSRLDSERKLLEQAAEDIMAGGSLPVSYTHLLY